MKFLLLGSVSGARRFFHQNVRFYLQWLGSFYVVIISPECEISVSIDKLHVIDACEF